MLGNHQTRRGAGPGNTSASASAYIGLSVPSSSFYLLFFFYICIVPFISLQHLCGTTVVITVHEYEDTPYFSLLLKLCSAEISRCFKLPPSSCLAIGIGIDIEAKNQ